MFYKMTSMSGEFYWPFLVIMVTPAIRLMLVGHWGQIMKDTVRENVEEICQY